MLNAGSIICDVCGTNLSIHAILAGERVEYLPFDMSLDGGETSKTLMCCLPCRPAVETMMAQNSPGPLPDGPLKTAIVNALAPEGANHD